MAVIYIGAVIIGAVIIGSQQKRQPASSPLAQTEKQQPLGPLRKN